MKLLERHLSSDGQLALEIVQGEKGEIAVGFGGGGAWHTHPDVLAPGLGVPEDLAVARFVELLLKDELPIVVSTDAGQTFEPWVSDNLRATLETYGLELCHLRFWSGRDVPRGEL